MPPMEQANRVHHAVVWRATGRVDRHGKPKVGPPEDLDVWWTDTRREVSDNQGGTITVTAEVITDQGVPEGSLVWQGRTEDLPAGLDFSQEDEPLLYVVANNSQDDIKGRVTRYRLSLARYGDTHPGES